MSVEHMDNFSMYGGTAALMLNGVYASNVGVTLPNDPDGISTGKVMLVNSNALSGARYVLPAVQQIVGVAARVWCPSLNFGGPPPGMTWYDVSANPMVIVNFDTTGRMRVYKYAAGGGYNIGTLVYTTPNPVITANGWWHIEGKLTTGAGATDALEVRVEGIPVVTLAASDLGLESIYQVLVGNPLFSGNGGASTQAYWKDIVIWNGSGAQNTNFLGAVTVYDLPPTADVSLNWTPTPAGNGYPILATAPPNDAAFITAPNPAPAAYVGSHGNLPPNVTSVKAIMTMVRAAKTDGGDASLQVGVISSPAVAPATVLGANRPITVAQTYWRDVFELDPKTAAAWLPAAVNASQIQINRTV